MKRMYQLVVWVASAGAVGAILGFYHRLEKLDALGSRLAPSAFTPADGVCDDDEAEARSRYPLVALSGDLDANLRQFQELRPRTKKSSGSLQLGVGPLIPRGMPGGAQRPTGSSPAGPSPWPLSPVTPSLKIPTHPLRNPAANPDLIPDSGRFERIHPFGRSPGFNPLAAPLVEPSSPSGPSLAPGQGLPDDVQSFAPDSTPAGLSNRPAIALRISPRQPSGPAASSIIIEVTING